MSKIAETVAQITCLQRVRERAWPAPHAQWEHATHVIGDRVLDREHQA